MDIVRRKLILVTIGNWRVNILERVSRVLYFCPYKWHATEHSHSQHCRFCAIYGSCLLYGGVEQYIGWHLGWQSVTMLVTILVECPSRVGQFISQVAFYCWLRVGQVLVNILMDCHCYSIGRVLAMYQWTISRVWLRYWRCIGWQLA